jgi:sugar/nucleoside kinase (ribokinase family)
MTEYVVYGKIIIDDIRLKSGEIVREVLGGGGPQGAFGARLWHPSVALLTRSGTELPEGPKEALLALDIDLSGWMQYADLPTARGLMAYDENEYMTGEIDFEKRKEAFMRKMGEMLAREIPIPESCRSPKVIHLITEFTDEPMADAALDMKARGAIYSLEPLIDYHNWSNREAMLAYFPRVDVVTPDWPSASGLAGSEDPVTVLKFWSRLGPKMVAVRDGARGSYVWDKEHDRMWHIPVVEIDLMDPTGCGNAYGGGLSVAWDQHREARMAGACATVSASFLAERVGVPAVTTEIRAVAQNRLERLLNRIETL